MKDQEKILNKTKGKGKGYSADLQRELDDLKREVEELENREQIRHCGETGLPYGETSPLTLTIE